MAWTPTRSPTWQRAACSIRVNAESLNGAPNAQIDVNLMAEYSRFDGPGAAFVPT